MKITLSWLKQYVHFNWSPDEVADRLTMLGLEVEGIHRIAGEFEGVVVAQVLSSEKHPNADKLSVCRVADGSGERQIVCGAKNYKVGDKVPLILPGSTLPAKGTEPAITIKAGKIRGVESHGMMCSPRELGMSDDAEGLLILPANAQVGQSFAEHLGRSAGDVVYDLEVTPNRPDLNSVVGIAREISALSGNPLHLPELPANHSQPSSGTAVRADEMIGVRIEDPDLCPRYTARVVRGVKIGASPDWLRTALEKLGVRSINNVVDVTNYVMLEIGQPLHAFDYNLLAVAANASRPVIVIRRAREGEKFTTLDGQARALKSDMLLIADETRGVALAGVMGGQNSEINDATEDVLIESAYFNPQNIRRTSKALGLKTDASYRFERGADVGVCDWASRRAAQLILEVAGGELVQGVVDAYPQREAPAEIILRHAKVDELLGIEIPAREQIDYLRRLDLEILGARTTAESVAVRPPSFRVDLEREVDLIEEIARLHGVDRIPSTAPRGAIGSDPYDAVHDELAEVRRLLCGLGLAEAQGQTLISETAVTLVSPSAKAVRLANPLSSDMNVLRPSLVSGLLDALRHNLNHKVADVAVFEIGRVFSQQDGAAREERRIAIAMTGQRQPNFWSGDDRHAKLDVFDLKGVLEEFFEHVGVRGVNYARRTETSGVFLESAGIQIGKLPLGEIGQLTPLIARQYDLRDAVVLAELNLDLLLAKRNASKSFKALPQFPTIRRDVAMLVPESVTHDAVTSVVRQAKPANLESTELFDVFRGKNIPEGQKSLAYAFTYRNAERTLTDAEVNAAHDKLVQQFKQSLQAVIRE